jgi:hypothetical protein
MAMHAIETQGLSRSPVKVEGGGWGHEIDEGLEQGGDTAWHLHSPLAHLSAPLSRRAP